MTDGNSLLEHYRDMSQTRWDMLQEAWAEIDDLKERLAILTAGIERVINRCEVFDASKGD